MMGEMRAHKEQTLRMVERALLTVERGSHGEMLLKAERKTLRRELALSPEQEQG